jgi:hypothetical protein
MKRKILFSVMLLLILVFSATQSCKKDEVVTPTEYVAAMPAAPAPAVDEVVAYTGADQTINLTWTGEATDAIKWDVYFGDSSDPELVSAQQSGNSYTAHVPVGGTYYWRVVTMDSRNMESESDLWSFQVNSNPDAPVLKTPADNATAVSNTAALTWTATDPEEDDLTFDVYFGTSATPAVLATGVTDLTYSPTLLPVTDYYWRIVSHDPYGGVATSPVWKFTTGALPVVKFVANYNVAETSVQNGAYAYTTKFSKVDNNTIQADNWWDSGWATKFTLDFVKNTIVMVPFTFVSGASTYIASGSGKIDQATGRIDLVYSVTKNGVLLENGTEIFTIAAAKSMDLGTEIKKKPKF